MQRMRYIKPIRDVKHDMTPSMQAACSTIYSLYTTGCSVQR